MIDLQTRWKCLCERLSVKNEHLANNVYNQIVEEYGHRLWHNENHLLFCFSELDRYLATKELFNLREAEIDVVEMAIFFHDIYYNVLLLPGNNEFISSEIACGQLKILGIIDSFARYVTNSIVNNTDCEMTNVMHDVDYAILGQKFAAVKNYEFLIHAEHCDTYTNEEYNAGRTKFLDNLLSKSRIFYTGFFFDEYEEKARENIRKLLSFLKDKKS